MGRIDDRISRIHFRKKPYTDFLAKASAMVRLLVPSNDAKLTVRYSRMVAQGATVAVLIASAGLSRIQFEDPIEQAQHDEQHSWEQMVSLFIQWHKQQLTNKDRSTLRPREHLLSALRTSRTLIPSKQ